MINEDEMMELFDEFPELREASVLLPKEMYAHFGLVFFGFSLVEHSLINSLTFNHVGKEVSAAKIKNRQQWEAAYDHGYELAKKMTFGNLVNNVIAIDEFSTMKERLTEAKKHRDYFAHHFFREEVAIYMSDEGCWHILYEFKKLRDMLTLLDRDLHEPFIAMCERLSLPVPSNEQLEAEANELKKETASQLSSGQVKFNWSNR